MQIQKKVFSSPLYWSIDQKKVDERCGKQTRFDRSSSPMKTRWVNGSSAVYGANTRPEKLKLKEINI